jgi:Zn-dependent protease
MDSADTDAVPTVEPPRLSRAALWILLLLPIAFLPFYRLTFPHIGLWPAAVIAVLVLRILQTAPGTHDRHVARAGIAAVAAVGLLTAVIPLSDNLPGAVPTLDLGGDRRPEEWWVKAATFLVLIFSITLHECAHALCAWYSGDSTAKDLGRLTLNPLRHVDPFGSIILPAILTILPGGLAFGWAKPVPISPDRFRHRRHGRLATSVAGVAANLTLALFFACCLGTLGILLHYGYPGMTSHGFMNPWQRVEFTGLPAAAGWALLAAILKSGVSLNMILLSLNVLPIPPLDGFGLLEGIAPQGVQPLLAKVRGWGALLFIGLLVTRGLDYLLLPGALIALFLNYLAGALAKLA